MDITKRRTSTGNKQRLMAVCAMACAMSLTACLEESSDDDSTNTTPSGGGGSNGANASAPEFEEVIALRRTHSFGRKDSARGSVADLPGFQNLFNAIDVQENRFFISTFASNREVLTAASAIPSSFTLVIADDPFDPDDDPIGIDWIRPGARFSSGNFYASVDLNGISAGQELVTEEQLFNYTANSIIWEAPSLVPPIQDSAIDGGGSEAIAARIFDAPTSGAASRFSQEKFDTVDYGITLGADIIPVCQSETTEDFLLTFQAEVFGNFEAIGDTWYRWAYEGRTTVIEDVPASFEWRVRVPSSEDDVLAKVSLVASSFGPGSVDNPFLNPDGGSSVGLSTFDSAGSSVGDTVTWRIGGNQSSPEICGDGFDNDCDGDIDENCGYELLVDDNQCDDDTIGVVVDGRFFGSTPAGGRRFFDLSGLIPGDHSLVIQALGSGGEPVGCNAEPVVTYGVSFDGGVAFSDGSTARSGEILVGEESEFAFEVP